MERSFDYTELLKFKKDDWVGFNPKELLEDEDNICLRDGDDFALLEFMYPGVYRGHYLYTSRGKAAIETSLRMKDVIFNQYDVKMLVGLTPLRYLGARWLNKKMGFKSHGIVETTSGPCELVILDSKGIKI